MAGPNEDSREGAPSHIHIEKKKGFKWLPWLLLALGVLALLLALSRCGRDETSAPLAPADNATAASGVPGAGAVAPAAGVIATTPTAAASPTAVAGTGALGSYLAGGEPAPRTFVFEKLNFDTGKSDVRPADAANVAQVATTLKQYPTARIRIVGYADARGAEAPNAQLGAARADSIKSALAAQGIDASRIETASGGENDAVASNATPQGRFENRRTELIVTAR